MTWMTVSSDHFNLNFLPGTAADTDKLAILRRLELGYENIRTTLGITGEPQFTVHYSPSRLAAIAHNRSFGRVWPEDARYEAIYAGTDDSFEVRRSGQLLTSAFNYLLDPQNRTRVPFLTVGLSEYLDQSGRDMHEAYALQLLAGLESRVRVAELETRDVQARNYGRAGSFVKFLVDRYGIETFRTIYLSTAVTWTNNCYTHATRGCIGTPDALQGLLDTAVFAATGEHWADITDDWQSEVLAALARVDVSVSDATRDELTNLFRVVDQAVMTDDVAAYRSTMDGFYCDATNNDTLRNQVATRAVGAFDFTSSKIVAIQPTGIKNFSTAQVIVQRADERGAGVYQTFSVEHFPAGWRVTYSPDWY
jgi:hypothetical protein